MNSDLGTHRSQWKQWLAAFGATSIFLSTSIDTVWTSRRENMTRGIEGVLTDAGFIMIGSILGAISADIFGRRRTLLVASIFVIPRTVGLIFANPELHWLNGSWLMDIDSGITCTVVPLYISEIADTNIRGTLMVLQLSIFTLGAFVSDIAEVIFHTNNIMQWNLILHIILLLAVTLFHVITLGLLPETPHFLNWKKRYAEAAESLEFFRGVKNVEVIESSSEALVCVQLKNKEHSWIEKIFEIFRFENRRSLAIIVSLIAINWTSGQSRTQFGFLPITSRYIGRNSFGMFIGTWTAKLLFIIGAMFTINTIERKLSLLMTILVGCISMIIFLIPLARHYGVDIVIVFLLILVHTVLTAVTLAYLGKFFPINVKAIASAAVISFAVLTRNVVFLIEALLTFTLILPFIISTVVLICAVFFVWIFFPNTYNIPCSEIMIEITPGEETENDNNA